jgi:glycosyltransferase involved in cell wall biosynthesis
VDFKGFVSNQPQEFQAYLSAADLFVIPSLFEPQGVVVLEALSMGLPVVASETGGIPHMVTENVGSLFEPGNYYELAKQIKYFYNDRDKLESMRRHCRPHIEKNFTWRLCAEQHIKAFKEIIS